MSGKYILHVDGDSFFASCVQAVYPHLKGKPVVTGSERGVITAASTEAKRLGISRKMSMYELKRLFPECVIVSSNYEVYELFSQKMFDILFKWSPNVEHYSVDEGFMDIADLPSVYHLTYTQIGRRIKEEIESSLDISVSVGIGPNKSIAKLASGFRKPSGLTVVSTDELASFLHKVPIEDIWGIGRATSKLLLNYRIKTAYDFASKTESFIKSILTKPGIEIWNELNGAYIFKLDHSTKLSFQSLSKTQTFTPPSRDKDFVYSQLTTNLERVCQKARRYSLYTNKVSIFIKGQDFSYTYTELDLLEKTNTPTIIGKKMRTAFEKIYKQGKEYRATGVILSNLVSVGDEQESILEDQEKKEKSRAIFSSIDALSEKYGERVVKSGATMFMRKEHHKKRINLPKFEASV